MRILAVLAVLALVAAPFAACGGGGDGGCVGSCALCNFTADCCNSGFGEVCTNVTSDGFPRCSIADNACKVSPR